MMWYYQLWSLDNFWYVLFLLGGLGSLAYGIIKFLLKR